MQTITSTYTASEINTISQQLTNVYVQSQDLDGALIAGGVAALKPFSYNKFLKLTSAKVNEYLEANPNIPAKGIIKGEASDPGGSPYETYDRPTDTIILETKDPGSANKNKIF